MVFPAAAAAPLDGYKATYMAGFVARSAGTSATTDIFTIFGSATKTVRVLAMGISGSTATAAAYYDIIPKATIPGGADPDGDLVKQIKITPLAHSLSHPDFWGVFWCVLCHQFSLQGSTIHHKHTNICCNRYQNNNYERKNIRFSNNN